MSGYGTVLKEFRRLFLSVTLEEYGGNRSLAAESLNMTRSSLLSVLRAQSIRGGRAPGGRQPKYACRLCRDTRRVLRWIPTGSGFIARRIACPKCPKCSHKAREKTAR